MSTFKSIHSLTRLYPDKEIMFKAFDWTKWQIFLSLTLFKDFVRSYQSDRLRIHNLIFLLEKFLSLKIVNLLFWNRKLLRAFCIQQNHFDIQCTLRISWRLSQSWLKLRLQILTSPLFYQVLFFCQNSRLIGSNMVRMINNFNIFRNTLSCWRSVNFEISFWCLQYDQKNNKISALASKRGQIKKVV